jgi:hypothetical protein
MGAYVTTRLLMDEVLDLSNINYKFMDLEMHLQSLWTYIFEVYESE